MLFRYGFWIVSLLGAVLIAALTGLYATAMGIVWTVLLVLGIYLALLVLFVLTLLIMSAVVDQEKEQEAYGRVYGFMTHQLVGVALQLLGIKVRITGLEKVPQTRSFLLVSNHFHNLDPIFFLHTMPRLSMGFVSKRENATMPIVGNFMHKLRCPMLNRENDREALKAILSAVKILKDGQCMGVFPEGYTSPDGKLHDFRNGVFKIAQKAKVPVLVCTLHGTHRFVYRLLHEGGWYRRNITIGVHVLELIEPEEFDHVPTVQLGNRIHALMAADLEEG